MVMNQQNTMKKYCRTLWLPILLLVLNSGNEALGQSKNKRANNRFEKALRAYHIRDVSLALSELDEALRADKQFFDALMLQSQILEELGESLEATRSLEKALLYQPSERDKWLEMLIRLCHKTGQYQRASDLMSEGRGIESWQMKDSLLHASVLFAIEAINGKTDIVPVPLMGNVNTAESEYYPTLYSNGTKMIFTRELKGLGQAYGQEDFYEATSVGGQWMVNRPLNEINTKRNEGAPSVRGDGRVLVFTACAGADGSYGSRQGEGSCDIFESSYDVGRSAYSPAMNVSVLNSSAWESQPALSSDGRFLFFVRAFRPRDGREMVQDIFICERQENEGWGPPKSLPSLINTDGREENPFLHSDGRSLYFASDGLPGMGGMDLFVSRRNDDGSWSLPENLGYPINTHGNENSLQVFPDGRLAIFATDRLEPGNLDLWQFELPETVSAEEVAMWSGTVVDKQSRKPVKAKVQVLNSEGIVISSQLSDPMDGQFTLPFSSKEDVIIQVEHPDFAFFSTTLGKEMEFEDFVSIELERLVVGMTMTLRDIRFEKSSADLAGKFQPELEQLARTLNQSDIRIQITGHTDADGSAERNMELSEQRAAAVARFLTSRGVDQNRMDLAGKGSSMPIASNETDEGKMLNRRTEIMVVN